MKLKFKVVSFALVVLLSLTGLPSDIVSADDSGEILKELGILKGDLSGDLLLDQPLKRQDVIVLLSRLLGVEELAENFPGTHTFTDVTNPYYDPFISWAETSGLTEGIGGGLFGFDQQLKNQQLLAFLLRALGHEFYGEDYSLVPGKAIELEISPSDESWSETTTRQLMADRTVALLRKGRVKYSNITLERALALNDDSVPSNGQLFQLDDFKYKKGNVILTFSDSKSRHNWIGTPSRGLTALLEAGPSIEDIELTARVSGTGHVILIKLNHVFYDSASGQLLASFETGDIPTEGQIELSATYLENRDTIAHEAAHVVQQKSPGTYEPGELLLLLEEILRDLLPPFSGTFSSDEFYNDELKKLSGAADNPMFTQNSMSGENPLYSRIDSFFDIFTEITLNDNVLSPDPDSIFTSILFNGTRQEIDFSYTPEGSSKFSSTDKLGDIDGDGILDVVVAYINGGHNANQYAKNHGFSIGTVKDVISELIIQLHLSVKPDALTHSSTFGRLTVHGETIHQSPPSSGVIAGIIVGTAFTNPELDDEIIVSLTGKGMQDLKVTYKVHDYGDEFTDEYSAYNSFLRYLDPDDDGDGLDGLVFRHNHKPISVTKPVDKATPLLMVADGGLGDHVTLHLENGEVMYWHDGIDNDCDGTEDDDFRTAQYIDTITVKPETSTLRTGRNPQTGKEIQISSKTTVVISHEDGSVTSTTYGSPVYLLAEETSYAYAKVVTDADDYAILVHIIENAQVVYIETREIDKSSTKILWTSIDDLTEEETDFLLSGDVDAEIFVFRQAFGPVQGSSYRYWINHKMAESVLYTPEGTTPKKVAKFKAGKALADTVKAADTGSDGETGCTIIKIGEAPNMASMASFIKFDGVDGESKGAMVVDSFFDIFTELSVDFRGHVTVLK